MKTIVNLLLLLSLSATPALAAGDLIVRGNVGIGTTTPGAKLDVSGGVRIGGADAVCGAATEGMVRYNSTEKRAEFCNGEGWMLVGNGTPVDVTDRSTDYPLKTGETVYVTYTNATSVPLHVATVPGEYEITISGSSRTIATYSGAVSLSPNNSSYNNNFDIRFFIADNGDSDSPTTTGATYCKQGFSVSTMVFADNLLLRSKINIQTFTSNKQMQYRTTERLSATSTRLRDGDVTWNDTTTTWTSLGTIGFSVAQSGTIIITRSL